MTEQTTLNRQPICMKACRNLDKALAVSIEAKHVLVADVWPTLGVDPLLDGIRKIPAKRTGRYSASKQPRSDGGQADMILRPKFFHARSSSIERHDVSVANVWPMSLGMMFAMTGSICDFKVLKSVVELVVVFVVNHLRRFKFSPKVLFHHKPMLQDATPLDCEQSIAVPSNQPSAIRFLAKRSFWIPIPTQSEVMSVA